MPVYTIIPTTALTEDKPGNQQQINLEVIASGPGMADGFRRVAVSYAHSKNDNANTYSTGLKAAIKAQLNADVPASVGQPCVLIGEVAAL